MQRQLYKGKFEEPAVQKHLGRSNFTKTTETTADSENSEASTMYVASAALLSAVVGIGYFMLRGK